MLLFLVRTSFTKYTTCLIDSFQDNLVKPVPERQTIPCFTAVGDDGSDGGGSDGGSSDGDSWDSETCVKLCKNH